MRNLHLFISVFLLFLLLHSTSYSQKRKKGNVKTQSTTLTFDESLYQDLKWRNIGPFRGGRSTAVAGVTSRPLTYYFGSTGGGVWKTTNAGKNWINISDGFFQTGSVGAIAVAESDPNVIYVGMGEAPVRGVMTSSGDGVYKSTDSGETWQHMGLEATLHISKIRIHPHNPDLVYVAAQGNPYKPNPERGIYRSADGGKTWKLILHVSDKAGASDLSMDMTNPRILYAAFWEHQRTPWQIYSGGEGSGIYKSKDSGNTWQKLTEGLPDVLMGKIGISVSKANPQKIWAIIESEKGGLYSSDNGGKTWKLINDKRILRARSWYYMHVFTDPADENKVYVLNAPFMKSIDGGKTFAQVTVPHGDNHDLWINPENPYIMINANDGGANISFNGGITWTAQDNQPTAQLYRVNTDNQFPYWVYGGQQDNSALTIPYRTSGGGIRRTDWIAGIGGCESAFPAFDPDNPEYVYAGCYQGIIQEWERSTRKVKDIMAYPFLGLGSSSREVRYRFNWNAPIIMSQHDKSVIYHAGNKVLRTLNRGISWDEISPDLTRNDTTRQGLGGSPITNEAAGGEVYGTIMYLAESPFDAGELWAGSDDGLVHLTRDGGKSWQNVTPLGMPEAIVNAIEISPHKPGTVYLAVTAYKFGDFKPYIYKTTDHGKTWQLKTNGIPPLHYLRVVREDPNRKNLLYAGTERGLFISFDGGERWSSFQLNLPVVPVTDLIVTHNDLVAATQGRAFWILDDLTPLHQLSPDIAAGGIHMFEPRQVYRTDGSADKNANKNGQGTNPYNGAEIRYLMQSDSEEDSTDFNIQITDLDGKVLRQYTLKSEDNKDTLSYKPGMNTLRWDLRTRALKKPEKLVPFGSIAGYKVIPATYKVRLTYGDNVLEQSLTVIKDPRYASTTGEYAIHDQMVRELDDMVGELYNSVIELRSIKMQISDFNKRFDKLKEEVKEEEDTKFEELIDSGKTIINSIDSLETLLIQPKQETFQDVVNYLNKLDANMLYLKNLIDSSEPPVTNGEKERFEDLKTEWMAHKSAIEKLIEEDLKTYNKLFAEKGVMYVAPVK